jgi:DNA-binding IclR family transcriptional regulator
MQLEIFTHLADAPREAGELAATLGVREERLSRLLYALTVSELLARRDGGFGNGQEAADLKALVQLLAPADAARAICNAAAALSTSSAPASWTTTGWDRSQPCSSM